MKHLLITLTALAVVILSAETISLAHWSIPAGAKRSDNEITITSGGKKHGELMWAPFAKTGNNQFWKVKVTLSGSGEIQASLGCYSVDKKRFLTRHPFAEDTKKISSDTPVEEFWYLTLPQLKEPVGWIRPALRIVSGSFSIRQIEVEAFEKMPLIEENLPLAKFAIPPSAKRSNGKIQATSGGKVNGELLWGPFRPAGDVKVWQMTVEFTGRGDIQGSLGCYDASKKRFITRYPFAAGNREANSMTPKKEVWYLTLPENSADIKWVRPTIRILSGEFTIISVHIKERDSMPPRKNHLDTAYTMPGEVLPVYTEPNLFPGFPEPGKSGIGLENELLLVNSKNASRVFKISAPIPVESGKKYILTGVYHTGDLKFGNRGSLVILTDSQAANWPGSLDGFKAYSPLCMGELVNRSPGIWQRKVAVYTVPEKVKSVRIGVFLSGNPASIRWRSIYFGLGPWETDSRIHDYDQTRHYRRNTEPLKQSEVDAILAARPDATAEILPGNSPRLLINGKKELPLIYFGDAFAPERNKTAAFQKAGISLQIIPLFRKDYYWVGKNQYRFDRIDHAVMENVRRNPNGNFIIGINVSPYKTWADEFPTETAVNRTGAQQTSRHGRKSPPCLYSKVYQAQAKEYIRQAIAHIKKQPYSKAVAGFMITGNEDGQFYYQVKYGRRMDEAYPPSALEPFRDFLRKRYNNDNAALQKSWNDPNVTFDTAAPPRELRPLNTFFWDRSKDMAFWDTSIFMNEAMGEFADAMCSEAKKAAGKKVITVMWWGRGGEQFVQPHFAQTKVVLPGKGMDLMGGQPGYWGERENGNVSYYPWIADSLRLNNKFPMIEADFRTWTSVHKTLRIDYHVSRYWTPDELRNALYREAGKLFSVGGGLWFYDMTAGWFNDPRSMKFAAALKQIADKLAANDTAYSPAAVAMVADEENFLATSEQLHCWNGPNFHSVRKPQRSMMRAGIKYDYIYLNDLITRKMTHYKVYCFLNLYHISPEKEAFIKLLRQNGKVLVWVYAPGYSTEKGLDTANISRITGIDVEKLAPGTQRAVFVDSPVSSGLSGKEAGLDNSLGEVRFAVTDKKAVPICTYIDGKVAGAMKTFPGYTGIYLAQPSPFTAEFLARIASYAGVHIFNRTPGDMFIHRRDDFMVLHGVEGNENIISPLPGKKLYDMTTGKALPVNADQTVTVKLAPGESRLLECR